MKTIKMMISVAFIAVICNGCVTENKTVGFSSGTDGFYIKVTGTATQGSLPFPEVCFAQNVFSYASAPVFNKEDNKESAPVLTITSRRSFFGSVFGIDDTSFSMSYIGSIGEKPEQTVKVFNAISGAIGIGKVDSGIK